MSNGSGNISNVIMLGYGQGDAFTQQANVLTSDAANSMGWFVLNSVYTNTAGHYKRWWKDGAFYQVPAGKILQCRLFVGLTAAANTSYQLAYDTTTFADDAASLTSGTWQGGAAAAYCYTFYTHIWNQFPITFDIPELMYPALQVSNGDSSGQQLICRLIDAP